ncbi:LuxQ periplasmic sensor domain-containing protein, partial [Pontibacterium sp.]|uniref:LuxQ periplasmic sensor domain-containing protein n=1 Tax=Pontibacterium sp. TaxID=2036026 RepID=UPI003563E24A
MQKVRFSTVILLLVFALLAASSAILLTPAYLGSEKALQHEIKLAYERDQRALNSLIEARFKNIQQISQEVIKARELRWALNANEPKMISRVIGTLLAGENGQHIDAVVIENSDGVPTVGTNSSLLGVQLPLEKISQHYTSTGAWSSVNVEGDEYYSVLRLTLPVVDERFGEVIGK